MGENHLNPEPLADRHRTIFVLIDALGWQLLDGRDFLNDLLPYRYPLRTVLGFSSAAIPTILTGLAPAQHGHWNLLYYDPRNSPFRWLRYFGFLPDSLLDTRIVRKIVKESGRRILGMGPGFECCVSPRLMPRFDWVEKRNIHARDGIPGVSSIFDRLAARGLSYRNYSYYDGSDEQILRLARQDLSRTDAGFFFVYLCEMDMFLHTHRDDPDKVARRLAWYEKSLRGLLAAARAVAPHTRMALFSDHGMAPVRNHFDLMSEIARTGMQVPRDYLAVYDSTMARFWFFSEAARQAIAACLHNVPCGRILEESELRDLGVFFEDHRYGELVFLLQPGWIVAKSDFNGPQWTPAGMHGYHPDDPDSDAVFLSTFRPDKPMRTIADIYSVMEGRVA